MSTYTDSKLKDKFEENFKEVWNAISSEEVPEGRQIGNQNQRDNFDFGRGTRGQTNRKSKSTR